LPKDRFVIAKRFGLAKDRDWQSVIIHYGHISVGVLREVVRMVEIYHLIANTAIINHAAAYLKD
jgi:hypothetical protein